MKMHASALRAAVGRSGTRSDIGPVMVIYEEVGEYGFHSNQVRS
jgi:hypothetical protein